jgi:2-polyprenyl-6-methoxyphenol hydroxylase-like FAD-dependent oxidoreductase
VTRRRPAEAVVCGGGFAGLLAARVLADSFERVAVVERDEPAPAGQARAGTPQAHHVHGMMARGAEILEELFPGLRAGLHRAGAPVFDFGADFPVLLPTGWAPRRPVGVPAQSFTRTALEERVREHVTALPGVRFLHGRAVTGLVLGPGDGRVTGVRVRPKDADAEHALLADLVVDATGRGSRTPRWLASAGRQPPRAQVVDARYAYASRTYAVPPGVSRDWMCTLQMTYAPVRRRGGGVAAVDGGRQVVSLMGAAGDLPPTDDAGFTAFAESLDNPLIASAVREGAPLTPVRRYTRMPNRFHRYDRLGSGMPDRLVVLGDALCAFNPVYGQGMTVAAVQALLLRDVLRARAGLDGAARVFQRRAARSVRLPWLIATSGDLGWQDTPPPAVARAARWYLDRLLGAVPHDPDLYRRFVLVQHMLTGPHTLAHPRALAAAARPRRSPAPDTHRPR